ncbi:MAG: choice-of-anchor J domain-containing protein, partial [Candidatus Marinimicrobia bacterium]|nr:choice-of-anchor J domain-containing protein [Candidatus Neomarinimicrobiota bacterium]
VTLTAPATEGENIGRLIITSDDLGVADTETMVDVTLDAIGPVAPTGLAAIAADGAVELMWDDPNPTMSRYLSGELSYEKLANAVMSLKDKANLTAEDKLLLESYYYSTTIARDAFDGSEASPQEVHELLLRSFDGYNVYRRAAGESTWGTALASGVLGFSYSDMAVTNGSTYEYAISASFTAGESVLSDSVMATPTAVVLLPFASDFETDDGGFNASGDWAWGSPDPIADGPDTAHGGLNVWGTVLDGDYPNNSWSFLTQPFDISGLADGAIVSFYMWHELETNWDYAYVVIDHDNDGEFDVLRTYTGNSPGWVHESVIIPDSLTSDYAVFGFLLDSDGSSQRAGIYIDDFAIEANVTPILAMDPASLEATLESGSFEDQVLNLANVGGGFLEYDLSVEYPDAAINFLLEEDFETGLGAFTDESAGAWSTSTTVYHGGTQSVVDVYGSNADDVLVTSAPIDLARIPNAVLGFWQIPYLEGGSWDNGFVEASTDGGLTWVELDAYNKYDCTPVPTSSSVLTNEAWIYSEIDLSMFGNQEVSIRFRLESDGSVLYAGWALDDIEVFAAPNWLSLGASTGTIASGENVDIPVHFNSMGIPLGVHAADVKLASNLEESPHFIPATLTVDAASAPLIVVTPDSLGFGHAWIEEPLPPRDVTVYNAGFGTTTNILSVVISGTDADQFALTDANTYPVVLPGDGMTEPFFSVAFAPTTEGEKAATLVVTNGVTREAMEFPLTGTADFLPFGNAPQALTATATDATVDLAWVAPYVEPEGYLTGFENEFPPTGWSQSILNTAATWQQTDVVDFVNLGMYGAAINWDFADQDEWLTVEDVVIPTAGELSFWSKVWEGSTYGDHYNVNISADNGTTWTTLWDASALTLGDWNNYDYPYAIDLSTYAGQTVDIAWQAVATGGLWYVWGIDDIALSGAGGTVLSISTGARSNQVHPLASRAEAERLGLIKDGDFNASDLFAMMQNSPNGDEIRRSGGYRSAVSTSSPFRELTGYNVFRAVEDGELEFLATTTEVTYTDLAVENGMTYVYAVTALYDEGESVPSNMVAATPLAVASMPFFSDFEADNGGFLGDGEWQWGAPTFVDGPDTAYSGLNVWGTVLDGDYTASVNSWLIQPFDLTGATGTVVVSFKVWYDTESCCDEFIFAIDHDNDNGYDVLKEVKGNSAGWVDYSVIIPDSLVSSYAKLALILTPDGSINYAGVYIDDFAVDDVLLPELALTVGEDFGVDLAYNVMAGSDEFTIGNVGAADLNYTLQYEAATGRISGMREISGAYAYSTTWPVTPGTTFNMSIYVQNASTDVEWVDSASVTFPVGVTINEMTPLLKINSTSGLAASGISDDGLYAGWGSAGGPANIYSTSLAMATINVTIDAGFTGDLSFDWFINGEIYGSEPHTASGTFVFMPPAVEVAVSPMNGTIAPAGSALITSSVTVNSYEVGFYPGFIRYTSNDLLDPEGWIPFDVNLAPASGTLAGMITSSYDNAAMADVDILAVETTTQEEHVGVSGTDGSYAMVLPVGTYTVSMAYDEYDAEVATVEISLNTTTTLDMAMSPNVDAPIDLVAEEVEGGVYLSWAMPGPETQLIAYHDGIGESSFYQNIGQGYGVVFDLSAYPDATIEMADFVHYGWGLPGLFNYNLHIIDWTDFSEVAVINGLSTSADAAAAPQLEEGIDLGGLSGLTLVGIFIEPLSGAADDAYPGVMTDASAPALVGSSYIISMAAVDASYDISVNNPTSGDFMVNLWIHNPEDGTIAQAPAIGEGRTIHESTPSLRTDPTKEAVTGWPVIGLPVSESALRSELLFFKVYSSVDGAEWTMLGPTNSMDYTDESALASQSIEYKVTALYDIAESDYSNVVQIQVVGVDKLGLPDTYALEQNYPNPFNPITFINYQLPEATNVKIMIYNVLGQKVATLVDQPMNAGYYNISWSGLNQYGSPVSSGVYLYRIETNGFSAVKKLMYLK